MLIENKGKDVMKVLVLFLIFTFFISSCSTYKGLESFEETTLNNQVNIEKFLIQNTTLDTQNITIKNSIITTINNLNQLQNELNKLNKNIENISKNIENVAQDNNNNLNQESIDYLNYLNDLTSKSNNFIISLQDSTKVWSKILLNANKSSDGFNFSDNNKTDYSIVKSITIPLKSFE